MTQNIPVIIYLIYAENLLFTVMIKKFSILLPVYNGGEYLKDQIDSIVKQTLSDSWYDLIIQDDCSVDASPMILSQYENYTNTFVKYNDRNVGLIKNIEKLVERSLGYSYVVFCDQDDIWEPKKLEVLKYFIENDGKDIYIHDAYVLTEYKRSLKSVWGIRGFVGNNIERAVLVKNPTFGCMMCVKRSVLDQCLPFPQVMRGSVTLTHDHYFILKLIIEGVKVGIIRQQLMSYRLHSTNTAGIVSLKKTPLYCLMQASEYVYLLKHLIETRSNAQSIFVGKYEKQLKIWEFRERLYSKGFKSKAQAIVGLARHGEISDRMDMFLFELNYLFFGEVVFKTIPFIRKVIFRK